MCIVSSFECSRTISERKIYTVVTGRLFLLFQSRWCEIASTTYQHHTHQSAYGVAYKTVWHNRSWSFETALYLPYIYIWNWSTIWDILCLTRLRLIALNLKPQLKGENSVGKKLRKPHAHNGKTSYTQRSSKAYPALSSVLLYMRK